MFKYTVLIHITALSAGLLLLFIVSSHNLSFSPDSMAHLEVSTNITKGILFHILFLNKTLRIIPISFIFLLLLNFATTAGPQWINHYNDRLGYTKKSWSESPTILKLKSEKINIKAYSNRIDILKLHTNIEGRFANF